MSQITSGFRSLLSRPLVYNAFQQLLGARVARAKFANEFIKVRNGDHVLDIGCGTAEILKQFPLDIEYVGFDISKAYIENARAKYGNRGSFHHGRLSKESIGAPGSYDIVIASGLIHHLDDREAGELIDTARYALRPGGRLVTIDPTFIPEQNPAAKFLIAQDRGQNVREFQDYCDLFTVDERWQIEKTLRHDLLRIPYTHIILEACLIGSKS